MEARAGPGCRVEARRRRIVTIGGANLRFQQLFAIWASVGHPRAGLKAA